MAFTASDIVTGCGDVGKPSTAEVSSDKKTLITTSILRKFNEYIHDYKIRTLTTVQDQQEYDVNANTVSVLAVYLDAPVSKIIQDALKAVGIGGRDFIELFSSIGLSGWDDVQSYIDLKQMLRVWQKMSGSTWKFINGKIVIIPPSESTGDYIAYISREDFTYTTVKDRFKPIFEDLYCYEQLKWLAAQRSGQAGVSSVGQMIQYPADMLVRTANEYLKTAEQLIQKLAAEQRRLV